MEGTTGGQEVSLRAVSASEPSATVRGDSRGLFGAQDFGLVFRSALATGSRESPVTVSLL